MYQTRLKKSSLKLKLLIMIIIIIIIIIINYDNDNDNDNYMIIIIMALFNISTRWPFIRIIQNNTKFHSFTPNIVCKIFWAGVTFMKLIRECTCQHVKSKQETITVNSRF